MVGAFNYGLRGADEWWRGGFALAVAPSDPAIANVPEMIVVAMSAMNCSYING